MKPKETEPVSTVGPRGSTSVVQSARRGGGAKRLGAAREKCEDRHGWRSRATPADVRTRFTGSTAAGEVVRQARGCARQEICPPVRALRRGRHREARKCSSARGGERRSQPRPREGVAARDADGAFSRPRVDRASISSLVLGQRAIPDLHVERGAGLRGGDTCRRRLANVRENMPLIVGPPPRRH